MTQDTARFGFNRLVPVEGDTAFNSPGEAREAYYLSESYLDDLDAWAIDEISKDGVAAFMVRCELACGSVIVLFERSEAYALAVDDVFTGVRGLA